MSERRLDRAPCVPRLEAARALLWAALAALSVYGSRAPADVPPLEARREADGVCRLTERARAAPCPCGELPTELRRVLGLPLSLARASAADLESLPGIGPRRAQAILEARTRRPFASVDELQRVRGIGPNTARALAAQLFVGADPACDPRRTGALTRSAAPRPD